VTQEPATSDQQTWRVIAHASAFIQLVGIPSVVGPLVVWLIRRDDPVVEPHAKAALNFQLTVLIYFAVGAVAAFILALTVVGIIASVVIVILLALLAVLELVYALLATIEASKGTLFQYPMSLNLIK
jgi:uncharacterized protein